MWRINLFGALLNVALNFAFIPFFGAIGAAVASLITQILMNFVLGFVIKSLRPNNRLMLRGLSPVFMFNELKTVVSILMKKQ